MSEFLRASGYDPQSYWMLAWTVFSLWLLASVLPHDARGPLIQRLGSPLILGSLLLGALIAFRWPAICLYKPVNPDEPQFLAGALTMLARRQFWWPDAMTSGPLVMAPLTLPALLGLPIDFAGGRTVGLLLSWGIAWFVFLALRHVHGERLGRLLVLPLGCFMILLNFWDFTAYSSEWLPVFLCAAASWLVLTSFKSEGMAGSRWRLAGAGAVLGILPFSKLQALPLGAAIGLAGVAAIFLQPRNAGARPGRDLGVLLGGAAAAFLGFSAWAWSSGNSAHILKAYVEANLFYAQSRAMPWSESFSELAYLTDFSWGFTSFHYGLILLLAASLPGLRWLPRTAWPVAIFCALLLPAAYYAALAPGRSYPHYLLFLTLPLGLGAGLLFGYTLDARPRDSRRRGAMMALFLVAGVGSQVAERLRAAHSFLRLQADANPRANLVVRLNQLKQPGDTLAVWGWRPELYVETQLPQAVRDAHTERQMKASPQRDYFRDRYVVDFQLASPAFFVDAVGSGGFLYQDRAALGVETFAELNDSVRRNYALVGEFDSFRLYLRRDRLPSAAH